MVVSALGRDDEDPEGLSGNFDDIDKLLEEDAKVRSFLIHSE